MKIKYVGPFVDGVELPTLNLTAPHGESVEVPDEAAESLLATGDWEKADGAKSKKEA